MGDQDPSQIVTANKRDWPQPPPRVLAFLHDNAEFGGIETLQVGVLRHLDPSRYRAIVVITQGRHVVDDRFPALLDAEGFPFIAVKPTAGGRIAANARDVWTLRNVLRQECVDVAHIQTRTPSASRKLTIASALARIPAIVRTEHVSPGPHVGRWTAASVAPFDGVTDLIITDSKADREEQIQRVRRRPDKVVSSYCGIDASAFDPHHDVRQNKIDLGLDPDVTIIGNVGRLHEQKGHRYLIDAAALVLARRETAARFLIVGDGPERESLERQVEALGISEDVTFVGYQGDPRPFMEAMDIVVMPSLWEGFSISMQEFMALGKPMIVSDHHSFREAIEDGVEGLIVPMRAAEPIAASITRLLENPRIADQLGTAAAVRAHRDFSIAQHVDDLMNHYDAVLATRSRK